MLFLKRIYRTNARKTNPKLVFFICEMFVENPTHPKTRLIQLLGIRYRLDFAENPKRSKAGLADSMNMFSDSSYIQLDQEKKASVL